MRAEWIGRSLVGLAAGAVLAAGVTVVGPAPAESAESITSPVPPVSVIAPTTTVAAPVVDASPAPAPRARPAPTSTRAAAPSSKPRSTTRSRAPKRDCAAEAMRAGRFDPSCEEYQGYLDPGTVAGRGPTSGEIQREYGCEQGYIPRSEC